MGFKGKAKAKQFSWSFSHLVLFKCGPLDGRKQRPMEKLLELDGLDEDSETHRFLDGLIRETLNKKADIGEGANCKMYLFPPNDAGQRDQDMLTTLLNPPDTAHFASFAEILAERYAKSSYARSGIFLVSRFMYLEGEEKEFPFVFVVKGDYEDMEQLGEGDMILRLIPDAISKKLKKCYLFPYFDNFECYFDRIKIFQKSTADYFHTLLNVEPPKSYNNIYHESLAKTVKAVIPEFPDQYLHQPVRKKRELGGTEVVIPQKLQIPPAQVSQIAVKTQEENLQTVEKKQKLRFILDRDKKFEAPLEDYGTNFWIADGGKEKFLLVRAKNILENNPLNPMDFLELPDLETLLKVLRKT